jgi:hypothetical protein
VVVAIVKKAGTKRLDARFFQILSPSLFEAKPLVELLSARWLNVSFSRIAVTAPSGGNSFEFFSPLARTTMSTLKAIWL